MTDPKQAAKATTFTPPCGNVVSEMLDIDHNEGVILVTLLH